MKALIRKSKNQSGIAIVLAMCLLLVVTIICSVILAAANTTTKGIAYDRKQQQAYLTVSDAAKYISNEISGLERLDTWDKNNTSGNYNQKSEYTSGCDFQPLMEHITDFYKENKGAPFTAEFYLYPSPSGSIELAADIKEKYEKVKVTIKTNSECDIITTLELIENNKISYRMSVYSEGDVALTWYNVYDNEGKYDYTHYEQKWSWNEGIIERGYGSRNEN